MDSKAKTQEYTKEQREFIEGELPKYREAIEFWRGSIHRVFDKCWLDYRAINALNYRYGDQYVEGYGLRVASTRAFQTVESIKPQLNARPPLIEARPFSPSDVKSTRGIRWLLRGDWDRSGAEDSLKDITDDMLMYGTGVGVAEFVNDRATVQRYVGTNPDTGTKIYKKHDIERYCGNRLTWWDPYNVFPEPTAQPNDPGTRGRVWLRMVVNVDDLREAYKLKGFKDWALIEAGGGNVDDFSSTRQIIDIAFRFQELMFSGSSSAATKLAFKAGGQQKDTSSLVEVAVCKEPDLRAVVAFCATGPVVLELGPNPNPHKEIDALFLRDYKLNGFFWGMGEVESIRHIADAETRILNNLLDAVAINVGPPIAYNSLLLKQKDAFKMKPWAMIPLASQLGIKVSEAIQPLLLPDLGRARAFEALNHLDEMEQNTTGISKFLIGTAQLSSASATEAGRKADAPMARIREKARSIEKFCEKVLKLWAANLSLYSRDQIFYILEEDISVFLSQQTRKLVDVTTGELVDNVDGVAAAEAAAAEAGISPENIVYSDDLSQGVVVKVRALSTLPPSRETDRNDLMQAMGLVVNASKAGVAIDGSSPVGMLLSEVLKTFSLYDEQGSALEEVVSKLSQPPAVPPAGPGEVGAPASPTALPLPEPMSEGYQLSADAQPANEGQNALERGLNA